jgi:hypothetical protein
MAGKEIFSSLITERDRSREGGASSGGAAFEIWTAFATRGLRQLELELADGQRVIVTPTCGEWDDLNIPFGELSKKDEDPEGTEKREKDTRREETEAEISEAFVLAKEALGLDRSFYYVVDLGGDGANVNEGGENIGLFYDDETGKLLRVIEESCDWSFGFQGNIPEEMTEAIWARIRKLDAENPPVLSQVNQTVRETSPEEGDDIPF